MDHSGHPADTGNSSLNNAANPAGTTLSPASASFMAANGSPFTSVDNMIQQGVRVVDPETTERTCTTTLTARLNIPVVQANSNEGKLLVIMSADPLSQMPLWVSRTFNETTSNPNTVSADSVIFNEDTGSGTGKSSLTDPVSWGQTYDFIGLDDFFAQTTDLGNMSLKHRVVGCALRANVGVDTSIARGSIEAGQFNWSDTRYKANEAGFVAFSLPSKSKSGWWQALYQPNNLTTSPEALPALTALSQQKGLGNLMTSNAYSTGERVIRSARTQDYGTLDADKGASVRWTDSNDFKFQKTYNRNIVMPDREFYPNGDTSWATADQALGYPAENNEAALDSLREYYILNCNAYRANVDTPFAGRHDNAFRSGITRSKLATKRYVYKSPSTDGTARQQGCLYLAADKNVNIELTNGSLTFAGSRPAETGTDLVQTVGEVDREALGVVNFEPFFDKGLYINIEGVSTAQYVTVEMVYHIEYMPKSWALTRGIYPPVDLQFDMLCSMLGDPKQFPIVVQGHSFFSSLWRGLKRAADTAASIAGAAGSVITSAGGAVDPRLALLGGALSSGASMYKRLRS